jgi:ribose/xylose/arabinose/galactoside ABC-type transport system permease subunit
MMKALVESFKSGLNTKDMSPLQFFGKHGISVAFVICVITFSLASSKFLSADNLFTVVMQASIIGTIALGVTFVVIGGNLDLSVGSLLSFSTVLVVDLHDKVDPGMAIVLMFLFTLLIGSVNGYLIGYLRLNSLIVTLGMLSAIQGITLVYTGGKNVDIADQENTWFTFFGREELLGIPVPALIFIVLGITLQIVLVKTGFGRKIFAIGGNDTAALFSGLRRNRLVFSTYLLSAFTTACAALILGSRVMGSQNNVGEGYELLVLAGVILGGTSLLGGSGSIVRTIIGVLILALIQNGLLLLGYPYYTQWLVTWVVIIVAVWLDIAAKRGKLLSSF